MRNAVQRRSHRERAQPLERKRLGLLEKHKDYSLRAKDWGKKKATLQRLREIAANRNEDEFSYRMISRGRGPSSALMRGSDEKRDRHWTGTVDGSRGNKALTQDEVRALKTQDMAHLRTVRNVAVKEVARLEERAAVAKSFVGEGDDDDDDDDDDEDEEDEEEAEAGFGSEMARRRMARLAKPRRILFAETADDRDEAIVGNIKEEDDDDDAGDNGQIPNGKKANSKNDERRTRVDTAARLQRRLDRARQRLRALTQAENALELQRARMAKTPTVDVVTRAGKKIKVRERKR